MIELKGKGDFEIHSSQIGILPLRQINSSLRRRGRDTLLKHSPSSQIFPLSVSVQYICFLDRDCAIPVFGRCLQGILSCLTNIMITRKR